MNPIKKLFLPIIILAAFSIQLKAQQANLPMNALFGRKYKIGETYRYKMTMTETHNGQFYLKNIVVCELKVVDSAGGPYDEVRWVSKKVIGPKDTTDQTQQAVLVKPYRISLDGKGRLDLPKIAVTEMTEPIQDFNTFFVAVAPQLAGIDQLKKIGDSSVMKKSVVADFANGTSILKGEDCLDISVKLVNSTKKEVVLFSSFKPPKQNGLTYLVSDMNTPVADNTPNNFQMVAPAGPGQVMVNYGREYFYINSTIRKADGKIVKADMFNQLNLKIRVNCNAEYKNCQVEIPYAETRKLTLELLE